MNAFKNYLISLLMAALFFLPFSSDAQKAGWHWQNPYLQGNGLNCIVMIGVWGWAVGDLGTVMRTSNEGIVWEMVDIGTSEHLNSIYMNSICGRGWIVGNNGTIYYTKDWGETWVKQHSGTTNNLYSVKAIEGDFPWICGNDVILRSYHHGDPWEKVNCPFHTYFYELEIKGEWDEIWVVGLKGLVISSGDKGLTWQSHPTPVAYNLYSISIQSYGDFRACGHQCVIIRSSDGGNTWVKEYEQTFVDLYDIHITSLVGPTYAVGMDGIILESRDGGETWIHKESGTINTLNHVCDQSLYNDIYVAGWYGLILKKEDAVEAEFEIMNKRPLHFIQSLDFINADTGWAVGGERVDLSGTKEGIIMHTTDGGATWQNQLTIPVVLNCVDFVNKNEGWAVGTDGLIKHTKNGGTSWSTQTCPIYGSVTSVFFLDENNGWIVTDFWGEIAHTTDGGDSWMMQTNPTINHLYDVFFINPQKGWAVGMDSTILRTTNGGQNWTRCDLVVSNNHFFRSVHFIDEMRGWTVGVHGIIMMSNDGGITWQEINTGFHETLQCIYFADALNGWATGTDGTILRSIDGGYTWFKQYSGVASNFLTCVSFVNLLDGWVSGEGGTIKRTGNGGFWNEPGTYLRNNLKLPVNNLAETTDTLYLGDSVLLNGGYQIIGLEVMIDSIIHERAADLEISLSHNGVTEKLVSEVSDEGPDFLWNRLTDAASKPVKDGIAPFSGNHKPYRPLTAFNGLNPGGEWILSVYDSKQGNTGTLKAWGIKPFFDKMVGIDESAVKKEEQKIQLLQNIPNPFNGTTRINWISEISGFTTLKIFNINGQEITTLENKYLPKGEFSADLDGSLLSAGVYYYQLQVGDYILTKKCVILKY